MTNPQDLLKSLLKLKKLVLVIAVSVMSGFSPVSCSRDEGSGSVSVGNPDSGGPAADTTAPIPLGAVQFASIGSTSMNIYWNAATDDVTAQSYLMYKLVGSISDNISSVSNAESNGTVVMDWTTNATIKSVSGLSASTTYYFNVLVKDEAGNKAVYTAASQATADVVAPSIGTSLQFSGVISTRMTVSWGAATDDSTTQSSLQYKLVRSTSNNISSVNDAESNGTVVMDWTTNDLTTDVSGLSASTTYFFNVLVKDEAGNKGIYVSLFQTTPPPSWSHQAYLKAPNNSDGDWFGCSVSLAGDTIAVGSVREGSSTTAIINGSDLSSTNNLGDQNGAVYVYKRSGNNWAHQAYLKAPNTTNEDNFGWRVSLENDTIAVGAHYEDSTTTAIINGSDLSSTNNLGDQNGAVYIYTRSGNNWAQQAYLKAPNNSDIDQFGYSISLSGDTIAVGALGEGSTTTEIINGSDLSSANNSGNANGAVYIFTRSGSTWAHQAYLKAPNNSVGDQLGISVSLSGDTIAVGSMHESSTTTEIINGSDLSSTNNLGSANGAVYVYTRSGSTWAHQAYLKAPNTSNDDLFGNPVSISGDTIAVGATWEDSSTTSIINGSDLSSTNNLGSANGAVYVYTRSGSTWSHQAYLKAPNNSVGDQFGFSVAVSGDTLFVGAPFEASSTTSIINGSDLSSTNNAGNQNGAVYVFKRSGSTWSHQSYLKALNNSDGDFFGYSVSFSGSTLAVGALLETSSTTSIINGSDLSSTNNLGNQNGAVYMFLWQ